MSSSSRRYAESMGEDPDQIEAEGYLESVQDEIEEIIKRSDDYKNADEDEREEMLDHDFDYFKEEFQAYADADFEDPS